MREASICCKEWEASSRRAPLLDLALMHYEFGEATAARNLLRESLAAALEVGDADPWAFLYVPLRKNWSEAVVSVMDVEEIEQWIEKLSRTLRQFRLPQTSFPLWPPTVWKIKPTASTRA